MSRTLNKMRDFWGRLRYAGQAAICLGPDVGLQRGARLKATDGAKLRLEAGVTVGRYADLQAKFGTLCIGARTHVGQGVIMAARQQIQIGAECLIAEYVSIRDQNHVFGGAGPVRDQGYDCAAIVIGDNVWIGAKATILAGVRIGDNAVIGANAVVTRDVPAGAVVGGVPARPLR